MKRFTAKTLCVMFAAAAAVLSSCGRRYPAKTEEQVLEFLNGCGIEVSGSPYIKTITVPREFGDVYESYNAIQISQGFDLSRYKAREATVYTYDIVSVDGERSDYTEAHVMVCDDIVIGADMMSPALGGGMTGVM